MLRMLLRLRRRAHGAAPGRRPVALLVVAGALGLIALGVAALPASDGNRAATDAAPPTMVDSTIAETPLTLILEPPPPDDYFPCSDCHEPGDDVDRTARVLVDEHEDKNLQHGRGALWCLDCHDATNRNQLHSASGSDVDFGHWYKLCRQCHGEIFNEWKRGVHGKRIGSWSGKKLYFICKHCHNPHSPSIKPRKPMPPPVRPGDIR